MKKFRVVNTATGRESIIKEGTMKTLKRLPRGYEIVSEQETQPPSVKVAKVVRATPPPPVIEEPDGEILSREDMIQFLKEQGVKVHPNLGDEKLKQKYEDKIAENG